MNAGNLAIIFGYATLPNRANSRRVSADNIRRPTLMGTGPNVADAGWQVRVIDTILQNTYQIFDDD